MSSTKRGSTPTTAKGKSSTPTAATVKASTGSKTKSPAKKKAEEKAKEDEKKAAEEAKKAADASLFRKVYDEQREAERVKQLEGECDTLKKKVQELTTLGDNNVSDIRKLIIHYDSKLNERDALLTRAQQTIQELTEMVTKLKLDAARTAVQRDNELARRVSEEQMECKLWRDKFNQLYNDEKNKRMENLERDKKRLEIELEKAVKNHALHATELEHKIHLEKTKIRYSMIRKIKETKNSLLAKTKDQLHTTTKRVIMENEQMTTELQYQSKETERTLEQNDKLRAENKALRRDVELAAQESTLLANRTFFLKKLIDKLTEKLKIAEKNAAGGGGGGGLLSSAMAAAAANEAAAAASSAAAGSDGVGGLDAKDQHIHKLETQIEQLNTEMQAVRANATTTVESTRQASEQLLALQDEGTAFVLTCLEDLKHEEVPTGAGAGGGADSKSDDLKRPANATEPLSLFNLPQSSSSTVAERKRVLELLLSKLRTTAAAATAAADQLPVGDDDEAMAAGAAAAAAGDNGDADANEPLPAAAPAPVVAVPVRAAPRAAPANTRSGAGSVVVSAAGGTGFEI